LSTTASPASRSASAARATRSPASTRPASTTSRSSRAILDAYAETFSFRPIRFARRKFGPLVWAFVLARAGLLDGRAATTHWAYAGELRRAFPRVRVDDDRIWVEDRGVFTSAGVCTGIDLALALVADDCGAELALRVARALVVFVQRSGGQAQFSAALAAQRAESRPVRDVQAWVSERLGERHTVEGLAKRAGMSPRNFTRVFTREVGCPPARFLARLRVEAARRALERGDQCVEEIAATFGFGGAEVMTRAFKRELRTTPAAYRGGFSRRCAPRATAALTEKGPPAGGGRPSGLGSKQSPRRTTPTNAPAYEAMAAGNPAKAQELLDVAAEAQAEALDGAAHYAEGNCL
jgi:AraC-like DNA-binding protein